MGQIHGKRSFVTPLQIEYLMEFRLMGNLFIETALCAVIVFEIIHIHVLLKTNDFHLM